jgi:hypothetical protein
MSEVMAWTLLTADTVSMCEVMAGTLLTADKFSMSEVTYGRSHNDGWQCWMRKLFRDPYRRLIRFECFKLFRNLYRRLIRFECVKLFRDPHRWLTRFEWVKLWREPYRRPTRWMVPSARRRTQSTLCRQRTLLDPVVFPEPVGTKTDLSQWTPSDKTH